MKVGDLIRISTKWGSYYGYGLPRSGECEEISGMIGIFLRHSIHSGQKTARVMLSSGWICDIFEPHVRIEAIDETR